MTNVVDYLALSGCLFVLLAFLWWQMAKAWKHEKQGMHRDLIDWQRAASEAGLELQALKDNPPTPSDSQLARHLANLSSRLAEEIDTLDDARLRSADPLRWLAEEAEGAREINLKKKLTGHLDKLFSANVEISQCIERLIDGHAAADTLNQLMKAGYRTDSSCEAIEEVLRALKVDAALEHARNRQKESMRREFEAIYSQRVRTSELDRARRQSARDAASLAFEKYKLPPMTPWMKFRSLASRGQRDNLE